MMVDGSERPRDFARQSAVALAALATLCQEAIDCGAVYFCQWPVSTLGEEFCEDGSSPSTVALRRFTCKLVRYCAPAAFNAKVLLSIR